MDILAIIPARGGSKGVPKKNQKKINGKPLIQYTIDSAKKSKFITRLIVSTDDEDIMEIARQNEIEIPYKRPEQLSKDDSKSIEVVRHAIEFFEKKGVFFDATCVLQPTYPFRQDGLIDDAIKKFKERELDALVSVLPVPLEYNPNWVFTSDKKGLLKIATGSKKIISRRQELPKAFHRDGAIYLTKTLYIKKGTFFGSKLGYIESDPRLYANIDTQQDWEKATKIAKMYKIEKISE